MPENKSSNLYEVDLYLDNKEFMKAFLKFAEKEFNDETILFIQEYRALEKEKEAKIETMKGFYEKFILPSSRYQLNISSEDLNNLEQQGIYKITSYAKIKEHVLTTIEHDVFQRFKMTKEYTEVAIPKKPAIFSPAAEVASTGRSRRDAIGDRDDAKKKGLDRNPNYVPPKPGPK